MATSTITEPETGSPLPAFPDSSMATAPMWGRPRTMLPGPDNPDPAPEPTSTRAPSAGADSGSNGQAPASIRELFKGRAKSYARVAETLFKAIGGVLNSSAAAAAQLDTDAWLPDEDDLETVAPPLGRIAARRIKIGANPDQLSDLEDIGMAAVGLVIWAAKGISTTYEARRERRRLEQDRAVYDEAGDGR